MSLMLSIEVLGGEKNFNRLRRSDGMGGWDHGRWKDGRWKNGRMGTDAGKKSAHVVHIRVFFPFLPSTPFIRPFSLCVTEIGTQLEPFPRTKLRFSSTVMNPNGEYD